MDEIIIPTEEGVANAAIIIPNPLMDISTIIDAFSFLGDDYPKWAESIIDIFDEFYENIKNAARSTGQTIRGRGASEFAGGMFAGSECIISVVQFIYGWGDLVSAIADASMSPFERVLQGAVGAFDVSAPVIK